MKKSSDTHNPVAELLLNNIPRDLIMGVEESLRIGAQRAYVASNTMDEGHKANVLGQMRHFHMNEVFCEALTAGGANPTPIRGNKIVIGRSGIITLSRFNISSDIWNNGRRSKTRRQMSQANRAIEPLIQPELFDISLPISAATAFFVGRFSGSVHNQPDSPLSIDIAVPDREMKGWLFREPLHLFIARYDVVIMEQEDLALPKLKVGIIKRKVDEA